MLILFRFSVEHRLAETHEVFKMSHSFVKCLRVSLIAAGKIFSSFKEPRSEGRYQCHTLAVDG